MRIPTTEKESEALAQLKDKASKWAGASIMFRVVTEMEGPNAKLIGQVERLALSELQLAAIDYGIACREAFAEAEKKKTKEGS